MRIEYYVQAFSSRDVKRIPGLSHLAACRIVENLTLAGYVCLMYERFYPLNAVDDKPFYRLVDDEKMFILDTRSQKFPHPFSSTLDKRD